MFINPIASPHMRWGFFFVYQKYNLYPVLHWSTRLDTSYSVWRGESGRLIPVSWCGVESGLYSKGVHIVTRYYMIPVYRVARSVCYFCNVTNVTHLLPICYQIFYQNVTKYYCERTCTPVEYSDIGIV